MLNYERLRAAALSVAMIASAGVANAADVPVKAKQAPPVDPPFFLVNDNRLTFSWMPQGTEPGAYSRRPDGSINGKTAKQVYSFTHFDIWAYGTNSLNISLLKSDHNNPAHPCTNAGVIQASRADPGIAASCSGATDITGQLRSTFGWNELFNTKAFTAGPLKNISFVVGLDGGTENNYLTPARRTVVSGLQFQFELPYKGFFNVSPLAYWEFSNNSAYAQCGSNFAGTSPGVNCLIDGNRVYEPTWSLEANYYMDLGFLPESMQFFSISGRAAIVGKRGYETNPLPGLSTAVQYFSEPIRLTFDASKAVWGAKYSHFVDLWVSYRYWQNKFGIDHSVSRTCNVSPGVSNNTCTESTVYAGITVKW
ncbi:hypothetical protein [Bradyrhizobium sp. DASA03007]|uniref:hypothetical protein n=1 Tax=unclassified Bradyrhizobium TaxID=2631580 RepID=UPI003F6FFE41